MRLYDVPRMMKDAHACIEGEMFIETSRLTERMATLDESSWGDSSPFGRSITPQRLGRAIHSVTGIRATRNSDRKRGYEAAVLREALDEYLKEQR